MRVYLIDGTFEVYRCFHGAPSFLRADGRDVGAARGLLHTLVSLIRKSDATHLAVAFDRAIAPVSRGSASDRSDGAILASQFGLAADVVRAFGIVLWGMIRYQADEALATAAARCAQDTDVEQAAICSNDKDFYQCVRGQRVVVLNRITGDVIDEAVESARLGVGPTQIPELFALVGDPADALPGIPGFGPKTAAALLAKFGKVEDIPLTAAFWPTTVRRPKRLAATLAERRNEAILYRNLSELRTDVPLPETPAELEWRGANRAKIEELVAGFEADEILERIPRYR